MKLNYFGYYFKHKKNEKKYLIDIRNLLKNFCSIDSREFKNSFSYKGENFYLFPAYGNIYLFVMTRNNEIIKKINTDNMEVNEIYELLSKEDRLGFASYVYIRKHYLGFASTFFAPKIPAFTSFINDIYKSLGINKFSFVVQPLLYQISRSEALKLPFIGKTTIEVDKSSNLAEHIKNIVSADADDVVDIGSYQVIIKPKRKQNIEALAKKFIKELPENGTEKFIIKAKDDLQDHLTDLYLVGKGAISDNIKTKDETKIYENIIQKTESNSVLNQKIKEFRNDIKFEKDTIEDIVIFNDFNSWSNIIHNI